MVLAMGADGKDTLQQRKPGNAALSRHQLEEIFDLPLALKNGDVDIVSREWWISFELPSLHIAEFLKVTNYVSEETTEVYLT